MYDGHTGKSFFSIQSGRCFSNAFTLQGLRTVSLCRAALHGVPNRGRGSSPESGIGVSEFQSWVHTDQVCQLRKDSISCGIIPHLENKCQIDCFKK